MKKRVSGWGVLFLIPLLVLSVAVPGLNFDANQNVDVQASSAGAQSRVYVWNYNTSAQLADSTDFGSRSVAWAYTTSHWIGFFIYDFGSAKWEEAFWVLGDNW